MATPQRIDLSKVSRGELIARVSAGREALEGYETAFTSEQGRKIFNDVISTLIELERRGREQLQRDQAKRP